MAEQKKTLKELFLGIFKNSQGKVVITQKPNVPIMVWFIAAVLGYFIVGGTLGRVLDYIATVALICWVLLEVFYGVNVFRRILGSIVLLLIILNSI